jgi:hypothetical protein
VDGEPFLALPALDGANASPKMGGDFFPGVETVGTRRIHSGRDLAIWAI